ncbi:WG repeat-containing protein [Flavobacterium cerinum]|uniref:WG repeat-containing protein n=1 Tax=Flavobacterium cerinum TaxID=2502784 RepID=A0ABY5INZ6_9FLAO|nr:WG repeat-containing protein [Flavobacterium cerinum]UUC44565.1 WG repeat-containing protein [Flavobacterium cerinum]
MIKKITTFLLFITATFSYCQTDPLFLIIENGKIGYINEKGAVKIQPRFLNGNEFAEGLASVRKNGLYGFINTKGDFVIQPQYDYAHSFLNGIARVYKNGRPLFINKQNTPIIDSRYQSFSGISPDKGIVKTKSGKHGMIDLKTQKLIVDTLYHRIRNFKKEGVAIVEKLEVNKRNKMKTIKYAVVDSLGRFIVKFDQYESINGFSEGYASVNMQDNRFLEGVIDTKGNLLFKRSTNDKSHIKEEFKNGLAVISLYKHWIPEKPNVSYTSEKIYNGYINLKGEIVLNDTLIEQAGNFSNDRAFIKEKASNEYKLIDTRFQPVGELTYKRILNDEFKDGFAIVKMDSQWGIIDTDGKFVIYPTYDYIDEVGIKDNFFFFGIDGYNDEVLFGIANLEGKIILQPIIQQFDKKGFSNGLLKAIVNNRLTYIDKTGNIIWQEKKANEQNVTPLNIDFMNRGYFYAYSTPDEQDLRGGWGVSKNILQINEIINISDLGKLKLLIKTEEKAVFQDFYSGYKFYVQNNTNDTIAFEAQDSRLYLKLQAQNKKGEWKDIEYLPSSWCGNSYHTVKLDPNTSWEFIIPEYEGEFKTKIRAELQYLGAKDKKLFIYSNEIQSSINPAQFWNKMEYVPGGLMDPYYD